MIRWASDEVLDRCTEAAGLDYDPVLGRQLMGQAEREVPGPEDETWAPRLAIVGRRLGLRMTKVRWSVWEAISASRPNAPVIAYAPGRDGEPGSWIVLVNRWGRKGLLAPAERKGASESLSAKEIARRLGLNSPRDKADWLVSTPLAPCDEMRELRETAIIQGGDGPPHSSGHLPGHGHGHGPSPIRRLFGLLKPELRRDLWLIVAYAAAVGILSLATPLAIEMLVTTVALNQMYQQLVILTILLFLSLAFSGFFRALQTYMVELMQRRIFARIAVDLAYRLPRVRLDAYDRANGPELVNRFFDVMTVQKVAALLLLDGISIVLGATFGLVVLAFYHPFLLGFDLVVLAMMCILIFLLGRGAIRTSIAESVAKYRVAANLEDLARAPLAYKGDGGPDFALDRTDGLTRHYLTARAAHFVILMRQIIFSLTLQALATSALLGLGGYLVIQQQITLGQLVAAELIVATVVIGFTKLGKHLEAWYDLMAAMDKLGILVDLPLERDDGEAYQEPQPRGASLRLQHVSYTYDLHSHAEVLHHLDLAIDRGDCVAIIGPSGSGKSTLVDLLFGVRTPTRGVIKIDGMNIRDLRLESLREQVAVVKGHELLEDTILENVRVGRYWLSLAEIREALEAVGLLDEIAALPEGLYTQLLAHGNPLSSGQARRVTIARAIVGRPRLLIIDEALDGLDLSARQRVLDTIFDRQAPWTLLIVTHDQDVVERCDRVVALTEGHAAHSLSLSNGHSRASVEDWLREKGSCRLN